MAVTVSSDALRDTVREHFTTVLDDAVTSMLVDMEADAPRRTGAMTQTIEVEEDDRDTVLIRTIRAPQEYSSYQDEGVEGPIVPVRAKALRFVASDGSIVFVKSTSGVPRTGWWTDKLARWPDYLAAAR